MAWLNYPLEQMLSTELTTLFHNFVNVGEEICVGKQHLNEAIAALVIRESMLDIQKRGRHM